MKTILRKPAMKPLIFFFFWLFMATAAQADEDPLALGEAHLAAGRLSEAQYLLEPLLADAEGDRRARVALALARSHLRERDLDRAEALLSQAAATEDRALAAAVAETRGRLYLLQGRKPEAELAFEQALGLAKSAGADSAQAAILLNQARFLTPDPDDVREILFQAEVLLERLENGAEKIRLVLQLGRAAQRVAMPLAYRCFKEVEENGPPRLAAQALIGLGELYEQQERYAEALLLVHRAEDLITQEQARDIRLRLEWLQGRLSAELGETPKAIAAYRRAINHLEALRPDLPLYDPGGNSLFDELLGPLYRGTVDLLLRQAASATPDVKQALLTEARDHIERYRAAELQDYFKDVCAVTKHSLAQLPPGVGTLYPVILEDRLELLLGLGDSIHQATVSVGRAQLEAITHRAFRSLRPRSGWIRPFNFVAASRLYHWLIEPVQGQLQRANIHTLVYVPDGPLRTVPLSVLWDGQRFLAESYATVTAPGLTLLSPGAPAKGPAQALLAGLSRPGPVVEELPDWMVQTYLSGETPQLATRGLEVGAPTTRPSGAGTQGGDRRRLEEALALPGVKAEIDALAKLLTNNRIENEAFRLGAVEQALTQPYRIVHLASHGVFRGDMEESFILTYDHLLNMGRLAELFQSEAFDQAPVELLTLSACQTAEGDQRSPLGLTGVAIHSGARSALGALWPVSDHATQRLLPAFYKRLREPEMNKALALQQAQLELMKSREMAHPFFWAAFILVGNWQ